VISGGNVYLLGEAYAFGVVWSFAMKALAVIVLRFTEPEAERWKVPLNVRFKGVDVPIGPQSGEEAFSRVVAGQAGQHPRCCKRYG